ncbi:hypothetical protein [Amycolatopsis suaedae]|uniref:Anti-sigma factor n=1 Tax=Amycolatopsis suaedae TaxID=2510978 RepID=A0A4Q7J8Z4_9PSEU|nr:hypothetical protein [Amycolatopsis suaedae]RZQ64200.1 hypothetical protein EWH70_09435 [Amycolatopsis suaedae]
MSSGPARAVHPPAPAGPAPLRAALARIRRERARYRRRRALATTFTAVLLAAGALTGGVVVAWQDRPATFHGTAGDIRLAATVHPADGWSRIVATVAGVRPGQPCLLVATGDDGVAHLAGSWVAAAGEGTTELTGAALVDPGDLRSISVQTPDGHVLVFAV